MTASEGPDQTNARAVDAGTNANDRRIDAPDAYTDWRRLHPTSLIFRMGALARALLIPGLFVLFAATQDAESRWELWAMVLFFPALLFELFRYMTLRYRFAGDEVILRQGLVFRNERHIPFARLQNIDLVQNPLHRMLKVANVRLETASGGSAEAELKVLSMDAVDEMRRRVFRGYGSGEGRTGRAAPRVRSDAPDASDASEVTQPDDATPALEGESVPVLSLGSGELVRLGVISMRGLVLVAIALGFGFEFINRVPDKEWIETQLREGLNIGFNWWVLAGAIAFIPVLILLSVIWTFLRFYGFKLIRYGEDLRITCGLLTKVSATVPRRRIQLLTVRQTLLHRVFGRVAIRIETAGGKQGEESEETISEKWIVPILPLEHLSRVLQELQPDLHECTIAWQGLGKRAARRMIRKGMLLALVLAGLATVVWRPWGGLSIVVLVPVIWWLQLRQARFMACAISEHGVHFRSGVLTRKYSAARFDRLQTVVLRRSPFDRRNRHARLSVDTAGAGPTGHRIEVPYLDRGVATRMGGLLFHRTEQSEFRWS